MELGRLAFALSWLCILAVHTAVAAFYGLVAVFYWRLESSYLSFFLAFYAIGLSSQHYEAVAIVHALCGVPHAICVLAMVCGSLVQRRLAFSFRNRNAPKRRRSTMASMRARPAEARGRFADTYAGKMASVLSTSLERTFGTTGFLGIGGSHYGAILVCRELLETALQTAQAYRMSRLLPRASLNHMFVGLLVSNCWSIALVRVMFAESLAVEWFLSLLLDCVLDLFSSAGVMLTIALHYLDDYDWAIGGFWNDLWTDDAWFARANNELQLVLVTSWLDLAMRVLLTMGAVISLSDMKALLRLELHSNRVSSTASARTLSCHRAVGDASVAPSVSAAPLAVPQTPKSPAMRPLNAVGPRVEDIVTVQSSKRSHRRRFQLLLSMLFGAWGLILLALHLHAGSIPSISQCLLQVRPWGARIPYCYLVTLNCHRLAISGAASEIEPLWTQFGRATVERILVRHCPGLEMPAMLREFGSLNTLKVYNSTITAWGADAAITARSHPRFALVYLVRVELPDGRVPAGLLSPNMPSTLVEITICASNLGQLPDDLDTKWPTGLVLNIELGELPSIPACVLRLRPKSLSVYGNPIETLPSELFQVEGMVGLDVGATKVNSLPEAVHALSSTLQYVIVSHTAIASFSEWIDEMIHRQAATGTRLVFAFGTPYCTSFERIANGSATEFPAQSRELSSSAPSLLVDAEHHWQVISKVVSCGWFFSGPFFSLANEDALTAKEIAR